MRPYSGPAAPPGDDPQEKWQAIRDIVMQVDGMEDPASGQQWSVEMTEGPFMYPSLVEMDSPIVQAVCEASEVMLGEAPETLHNHRLRSGLPQPYGNSLCQLRRR